LRGFKSSDGLAAMDQLQQVWHGLNLLLLPLGLAAIHAALCKLLWRRALAAMPWWRLALWCALAAVVAELAGFAWLGRDGAMPTYGAIVVVLAVTTWLAAFAPWRRAP
jgi:hypothetical protein